MTRHESLLASDAERDAVTDRLRRAAGEGRLEPDELGERVEAALRSRTRGELARLLVDLPVDVSAKWRRPPPRSRARPRTPSALAGAGLVAAVMLAVAVALVTWFVALELFGGAMLIGVAAFWLACCSLDRASSTVSACMSRQLPGGTRRAPPTA